MPVDLLTNACEILWMEPDNQPFHMIIGVSAGRIKSMREEETGKKDVRQFLDTRWMTMTDGLANEHIHGHLTITLRTWHRCVFVGGEPVVHDGRLLTLDERPLVERAEAISRRMADQLPDDWLK